MLKQLIVDPHIKVKHSDLLEPLVVIRLNKFTEESAEKFSESMNKAHENNQPVVPIIVDSFGGSVYNLFSIITEIKNSKLPVATIVEGKAMSAGAVLFAFGTEGYRYMAPHSTLMIHEVSSFCCGKLEELKIDVEEYERLNNLIFQSMAIHCGKEKNYFLDLIHEKGHIDWYMTPKEAKKHNITNYIKIPDFSVEVKVNFKFG